MRPRGRVPQTTAKAPATTRAGWAHKNKAPAATMHIRTPAKEKAPAATKLGGRHTITTHATMCTGCLPTTTRVRAATDVGKTRGMLRFLYFRYATNTIIARLPITHPLPTPHSRIHTR